MLRKIMLMLLVATVATGSTVTLTGPAGVNVNIDGKSIGTLPLEPFETSLGNHIISATKPGFESFVRNFSAKGENDYITIDISLEQLSRKKAFIYSLTFAGLGQRYQNKPKLGWTLTAIEAGGLLFGFLGEIEMQNQENQFTIANSKYNQAVDSDEIARWKAEADTAYSKMSDAEAIRNSSLAIAAGAVAVGLLDSVFRFPSFETKVINNTEPTIQAGLSFNF